MKASSPTKNYKTLFTHVCMFVQCKWAPIHAAVAAAVAVWLSVSLRERLR